MMLNRSTQPSQNCKLNRPARKPYRFFAGAVLAVAVLTAPLLADGSHYFLILDPYFYRSPLTLPVEGTKETVFAFYRADADQTLAPVKPQELSTEDQAVVKKQTERHARRLLEISKPEIIRNSQGVVTALRVDSSDPTLSSMLLVPDIGNHYANLLGPDCYLAVPNRQTVLFFPRLASNIQSFAPLVHSLYHNDPWPISTEIFEVADGKLRASGRFSEDF